MRLWEGTSEKLEDRKYIKVIIDQEEIFDEKLQDGLVNVVDLKTESVKMSIVQYVLVQKLVSGQDMVPISGSWGIWTIDVLKSCFFIAGCPPII